MSTATAVPETWELTGDDARETLLHTGRRALIRDAFLRLRASDGFSHARSLAFAVALVLVQAIIALVGQSRELLAFLQLRDVASKARIISAPKIIATDSIPASINVGTEVPTLTAQALTGAQTGGNSLFANSISNRNTGVPIDT